MYWPTSRNDKTIKTCLSAKNSFAIGKQENWTAETLAIPYLQLLKITLRIAHFQSWHNILLKLRITTLKNYTMANDYTTTLIVLKRTNKISATSQDNLSEYLVQILSKWVTKTQTGRPRFSSYDTTITQKLYIRSTSLSCHICLSFPCLSPFIGFKITSFHIPLYCFQIPWFYTLPINCARTKTHY